MQTPGIVEIQPIPNARTYLITTVAGEPAIQITVNGDLFPADWHPAMLQHLERRWVHRVRPPLRLVAGGTRPLPVLPADDPYSPPRPPADDTP